MSLTVEEQTAYRAGWLDAHAQIGAALNQVLADLPVPRAPKALYACCACGQELRDNEVVAVIGSNREGRYLYQHARPCKAPQSDDQTPRGTDTPTQGSEDAQTAVLPVVATVQDLTKGLRLSKKVESA